MKIVFLLLLLVSCASKPKLYPNEKLKAVGKATAEKDVVQCIDDAEKYLESTKGKQIAKGAGAGAAIGAAIGVVYTLLELIPVLHKWLPSSMGIGLGMVLSVGLGLTFFVGGFIMWIVLRRWFGMKDITLTTIAIGCIVAEGIGGVMKPGLLHLGWLGG